MRNTRQGKRTIAMAIVIVDATATKRNPTTKRAQDEMVAKIERWDAEFFSDMKDRLPKRTKHRPTSPPQLEPAHR
jgi:hypothetical protein